MSKGSFGEPWPLGCTDRGPRLSPREYDRARACVNALDGIPDPEEWVRRVERLVKAGNAIDPRHRSLATWADDDAWPVPAKKIKALSAALAAVREAEKD